MLALLVSEAGSGDDKKVTNIVIPGICRKPPRQGAQREIRAIL
jgi:hypothetical protein